MIHSTTNENPANEKKKMAFLHYVKGNPDVSGKILQNNDI